MPENKTKPTDASVEDYIASRANANALVGKGAPVEKTVDLDTR